MDDDLVIVNLICDQLQVPRGEALYYLEGFEWNLDSAMEACRNKTLPLPSVRVKSWPSTPSMVTDSRSILNPPAEKQPSPLKNQGIESFCNVSLDSQRVSGDESSKEEICPSMELSSLQSQFHASVGGNPNQDYLKQVKVESSSSSCSQSSPPIILNSVSPSRKVDPPSSRESDTTDPPLQGIPRKPEEELIDNSQRESDIPTDPDATISVVIVSPTQGGRTTTQGNLQQPGDAANQNRWSAFVKSCNEMIAFLTAAALAFVPLRYVIDVHNKYGRLQVADYLKIFFRFFEDFRLIDPFVMFALGYAAFYIMSSASFPRWVVHFAEVISICCGFGVVFSVIYYTSHVTFYIGIVSFGLFIVALTIREFLLGWRSM